MQGSSPMLASSAEPPLLEVRDLEVCFHSNGDVIHAVNGVSFDLPKGRTIGIVGESGSGKSTIALALLRLLPAAADISGGDIRFNGRDLLSLQQRDMRKVRGKEIGLVFQDPMSALNPVLTIGDQLVEALALHQGLKGRPARDRAIELLRMVGFGAPESRLDAYPHQLSGGMRQRVMIALAISGNPKILIADEPTTALDVTIQAQILELLARLREQLIMSIILVSHDLGVVARLADRVLVMYGGTVVEDGAAEDVLLNPRHPYTIALIAARPELNSDRSQPLRAIPGAAQRLTEAPGSCPFEPRCSVRMEICATKRPALVSRGRHATACWANNPSGEEGRP